MRTHSNVFQFVALQKNLENSKVFVFLPLGGTGEAKAGTVLRKKRLQQRRRGEDAVDLDSQLGGRLHGRGPD